MKKLLEFVSDGTYLSASRLIYVSWALGVLIVWVGLNIYSCFVLHAATMIGLHPMVLAFLGTLTGGKLIQNYTENKIEGDKTTQVNTVNVEKTTDAPK